VAEALWVQRIAWRFLGTLRLLLFAPPGNKRGVAPARSLRAGRVTVRETISEEQTCGSVRGDRRDSGGCEHESREARRETAGRSTTGNATIRPSSNTRSEEHTSELQSRGHLVCRLLLEKKKLNLQAPVQGELPVCDSASVHRCQ